MKGRIGWKIAACLAVVVLCVSGCKSGMSNAEAEQKVKETWQEYQQMYVSIWGTGLGYKGEIDESILIKGDSDYDYLCPVEGDITTMQQLKDAVEKVCTPQFAEDNYYKPYLEGDTKLYEEKDGKLYIRLWANTNYIPNIETCTIKSVAKDKIVAELVCEKDSITGEQNNYSVTIVLLNEEWLIDKVEQIK